MTKIETIFSDPDNLHGISLFENAVITEIEKNIIGEEPTFRIKCLVREDYFAATPEEIVRQIWLFKILNEYGYQKDRLELEKNITFGSRESGKADIVIHETGTTNSYIIFEIKRPSRSDGVSQLKSYCNAEGAPIGVWSNGNEIIVLHREPPNSFIKIPIFPRASERLVDILSERYNIIWLEVEDELRKGQTTLIKIILDLEEHVLANAGVVAFDEIFKLIYSKLYDEWLGINDSKLEIAKTNYSDDVENAYNNLESIRDLPDTHPLKNLYQLDFYVGDRNGGRVKRALDTLFEGAKRQWPGVFKPTDVIELSPEHLKICISFLEKIKLFNSNLQIIDDAFEYLISEDSKTKEGQYFTPRPVVDMIVKMLNPKNDEFIIDPACGSAGFLLHSVLWVSGGVITGKELPIAGRNFAQNNIYGIDFAVKSFQIAKAINLIVGDGRSHIFKDNSLTPQEWRDITKAGLRPRLQRFPTNRELDINNQEQYTFFDFDILLTNPPFAGTIKQREILNLYELGKNKNGSLAKQRDRHILFLNRCLQFIKTGGRMAIILPQGLFNNISELYIRDFILSKAQILAVIGLHENTFKPHTSTKTSVLFLRKFKNDELERQEAIRLEIINQWEDYFNELKEKFKDIKWNSILKIEDLDKELKGFIDNNFEYSLELTEEQLEELEPEEVSENTIGAQIIQVLNKSSMINKFKEFWIEERFFAQIDYPIFFSVNLKPVKNNKGEYSYIRDEYGRLILDENGHPKIEHDLDEIADNFKNFAKRNNFDFWR